MHPDVSRPGQLSVSYETYSPEWRVGRSWSASEIEARLAKLGACALSAPESDEAAASDSDFRHYYSESRIFESCSGNRSQSNDFERACALLANYDFSDPRIVVGHFNQRAPLLGRHMLLELKAVRLIHYLSGVVVRVVRDEMQGHRRIYGFRYDTLVGHLETGFEWFLLTRDTCSGAIVFRIQATWKPGQFPNWWSRLGFFAVGRHYQRAWHRLAHLRMRELLRAHDSRYLPAGHRELQECANESEGETQ